MIELVSSNNDPDYQRKLEAARKADAKAHAGACLREVFANLLRIARGHGKTYELTRQMWDFLEAVKAHDELPGGKMMALDLAPMVSFDTRWRCPHYTDEQRENPPGDRFEGALDTILRGAAQVMASRLVWQRSHQSRGEDELLQGVEQISEIWKRNAY